MNTRDVPLLTAEDAQWIDDYLSQRLTPAQKVVIEARGPKRITLAVRAIASGDSRVVPSRTGLTPDLAEHLLDMLPSTSEVTTLRHTAAMLALNEIAAGLAPSVGVDEGKAKAFRGSVGDTSDSPLGVGGALAACPFCGTVPTLDSARYIRCHECGAEGSWHPTLNGAIAAWNRRATPSPRTAVTAPQGKPSNETNSSVRLTDAQVEAACAALKATEHNSLGYWERSSESDWKVRWRKNLRAAMEAALAVPVAAGREAVAWEWQYESGRTSLHYRRPLGNGRGGLRPNSRPLVYGDTAPAPEQGWREDALRYRWLMAHSFRMSEPLYGAASGNKAGHRVSVVCDVEGEAPWATVDTFNAAIDAAMKAAPPKEPT